MKNIFHGNANKSGVYKIINTTNGRIYIGSTIEFKTRSRDHSKSLLKGTHHNKFLQNDFNKCGSDAFEFHVVEVVAGTQTDRLLVEEKYIIEYHDNQDQCYNFVKTTEHKSRSCFSYTPEETKKLISKNSKSMWKKLSIEQRRNRLKNAYVARDKKETHEKISKALTGRKLSAEHVEKMRKSKLGKKFGPHKKESIEKMILNRKNRKQVKVMCGKTTSIFPSINSCARGLGISAQTILNVLNEKYKNGYKTSDFIIELVDI